MDPKLNFSEIKEKMHLEDNNFNNFSNNNSKKNDSYNKELNEIFEKILIESNSPEESSFHCEKLISLFVRKYRIYMNEILNRISLFFSENEISCKLMAKCIIAINNVFTVKKNIINLGNLFVPLFINKITQSKTEKISSLKKLNNCVEILNCRICPISKKYSENIINNLLNTLLNDKNLNENNIYAIIHLLSKLLKKCALFLLNKIESKGGTNKFLNALNFCSHSNKEIRLIVGESVSSFFYLIVNRDIEARYFYLNRIYKKVSEKYLSNLKDNDNIPNDYNILSGYIIVLKKFISFDPLFLKKFYITLVDDLFKCKNSNKSEIQIEFIKFFPELYLINKSVFIRKYIKPFLEYINPMLNIKTKIEIRNAVLLSLGTLSQIIKPEVFNISKNSLISFISILMENNSLDNEIFKCLADLINNKDKFYFKEIFENFSVYSVLPKLFDKPLSANRLEYILSIFKCFDNNTNENILTTIISLNVISLYICNEEMKLDNFNRYIEEGKIDIEEMKIKKVLQNIKIEIIKTQKKSLYDFEDNKELNKHLPESQNISNKNEIISNALILLSYITNELFYKDMLIFYSEKVIKLLSSCPNKLYKKIIELLLCKFIKKYPEDLNISEYILNKILSSVKNSIMDKKTKLKEFTWDIIIKSDIFLDIIWKDKYNFLIEINGMLKSNEEENVKKKLIELTHQLLLKYTDKSYCLIFTKNTVNSLISQLYHSYDITEQENLSFSLLFFSEFLKQYFNTCLIEKILKVILYLIVTRYFKSIMIINILKILKELLISGMIKEKYSDFISDLLNILYVLCLSIIKESIIDDSELDLLLEVVFQIIKTLNINIYAKYTLRNHLKSSFLFLSDKNKYDENSNNQIFKAKIEQRILEIIDNTKQPNILELLFIKILNTENSNNVFIIMKIFGFCGAVYPPKMELLFKENNLNTNILLGNKTQQLMYESDDLEITIYNSKLKQYETINFSSVDPSSVVAVSFIIEIIKRDTYPELTKNLISHLYELIGNIDDSQSDLIFIILPAIIKIIPKNGYDEQIKLFNCIYLMMNNFKVKCRYYLDDTILLVNTFFVSNYLDTIYKLLSIIFENYIDDAKNYFSIFIPKIFVDYSNIYNDINLLIIIIRKSKNNNFVTPYLRVLMEEIMPLYLNNIDEILTRSFLILFYEMTELTNIYIFYHLIIKILLKKIAILCDFKLNCFENDGKIQTKTKYLEYVFKTGPCSKINNFIITRSIDVFSKMNQFQRTHFIPFGLSIIKIFKNIGLFDFLKLRNKFNFLVIGSYDISFLNKNSFFGNQQFCRFNCIDGVILNSKNKKLLEIKKSNNDTKNKIQIINKKNIDPDIIINLLNNSDFTIKEDWNEMQGYFSNLVFEQAPSYFLYCCNLAYDYYGFAIMLDLINDCIYSIYLNISDSKKLLLSKSMKNIIINNKASENIKLLIINLEEFMERKNYNINILDHGLFGKISNNCHSYAKALYYMENDFLNQNFNENYVKLIELYNNLCRNSEAGIGLIKFAEKNNIPVTYKSYIYIKYFEHALKLIKEELLHEKNEKKIEELKNDERLCQFGLFNWEELLNDYTINDSKIKTDLMNESINSDFSNEEIDNNISNHSSFNDIYPQKHVSNIKGEIEKEIILSKASLNLCKWDQLDKHLAKIKMIFINNLDEDENILNDRNLNDNVELDENDDKNIIYYENNFLNKTIGNNDIKDHKNSEKFLIFNSKCQFLNNTINHIKKYLPFNELVYKYDNLSYLIDDCDQLYYINYFSTILNLINKNYDISEKYLNDAKKIILNKIKPLLNESYTRSFDFFLKNQELHFIEDIINYEKYHLGDNIYLNELKKSWDKIYSLSIQMPSDKIKCLVFYNILFPIEEIYDKYIQLSKSCRESNLLKQSESILKYIKNKIGLNVKNIDSRLFNEINIKIDLDFCKCLFEKGEIDYAIKKLDYLIELLDKKKNQDNWKINDKLKSKIYGYWAEYSIKKKIIFSNDLRKMFIKKNIDNINHKLNNSKNFDEANKKSNSIYSMEKGDFIIKYPSYLKDFKNIKNLIFPAFIEIDKINNCFNMALKYNPTSAKHWNNYALYNYKCYKIFRDYKFTFLDLSEKNTNGKKSKQEITFAINTIKAIKNCLLLSGKQSYEYIDNALRLLDVFINSAEGNDDLLLLIKGIFDDIYIKPFTFLFVQLEAVIKSENSKVLEVFKNFLIKIILNENWFLISWYIPLFYLKEEKSQTFLKQVFYQVKKIDPSKNDLINAYLTFINELNKCTLLLHEEWKEVIEISSELMINKNYDELVYHLLEMHKKMNVPPESMNEIHFHQQYGSELKEAEKYLQRYIKTKNKNYIKEGWEIYIFIYINIRKTYKHLEKISLEYIAPKLVNNTELISKIYVPGQILLEIVNEQIKEKFLKKNKFAINNNISNLIYLKKINNILYVFKTKHQPKKITFVGTNDKEYKFLLKGHEDLRQDNRLLQLFILVNSFLLKEKNNKNQDLYIKSYMIIPFTKNTGIISWVNNSDSIYNLIVEHRKKNNINYNIENEEILKTYPKFASGNLLSKVEIFKEITSKIPGTDLKKIIWLKSKNCESWFIRRTNYSKSLAVMSMVGYIVGLGDRHPNNLLMERDTGKIVHIDFGDCFEVAMKRKNFPEKIPFRLTRMFVNALEVSGIEGTFRITCEFIMKLLRENKDSLIVLLNSFIYDSSFALKLWMIKTIKKKERNEKNFKKNIVNTFNIEINFNSINTNSFKENMKSKLDSLLNSYCQKSERASILSSKKEKSKKEEDEKINIFDELKKEKQKVENEHKLLANTHYKNGDENKKDELYNISKMIIQRIMNKLTGYDFELDKQMNVKDQVDRLINQAILIENIVQSYLGWCPYW